MKLTDKKERNTFIVIATYNGMRWLPRCLESCGAYKIIVVDNASTDKTVEFIEMNYPETVLLKQSRNLGFGQANNLGISHALKSGADSVFLLNQDAYLYEGSIGEMLELQNRYSEFGILSPIHLDGKGERLDLNFSDYVSYRKNKDFYSDYVLNKERKDIYELPFVNAAGWLVTKDLLETIGGFDPIFFHYGEDENFCQRARYHGFKIGVVPNVFLNHDREERRQLNVYHLDPFLVLERKLKSKYADVNMDNLEELNALVKKRKRELIKLFVRLKFSKLSISRQKLFITEKVLHEVQSSREKNKSRGRHYLE